MFRGCVNARVLRGRVGSSLLGFVVADCNLLVVRTKEKQEEILYPNVKRKLAPRNLTPPVNRK